MTDTVNTAEKTASFGDVFNNLVSTAADLFKVDFLADRGLLPGQTANTTERQVQTTSTPTDIRGNPDTGFELKTAHIVAGVAGLAALFLIVKAAK